MTAGYRGKRLLDLAIAIPALALLSPLMAALAILIALKMGRPVLFMQERPGLNERPFRIYKFRTMVDRRGSDGRLLPDGDRITPFGAFLRASSLDELPELFNVVRGEMSLVGPRPLLMRYLPHFTERERLRAMVRPGITGWAQINGRNDLPWDERFALDVWYVENCAPSLDLRILALTAYKVLRRAGVQIDTESEGESDFAVERSLIAEQRRLAQGHDRRG